MLQEQLYEEEQTRHEQVREQTKRELELKDFIQQQVNTIVDHHQQPLTKHQQKQTVRQRQQSMVQQRQQQQQSVMSPRLAQFVTSGKSPANGYTVKQLYARKARYHVPSPSQQSTHVSIDCEGVLPHRQQPRVPSSGRGSRQFTQFNIRNDKTRLFRSSEETAPNIGTERQKKLQSSRPGTAAHPWLGAAVHNVPQPPRPRDSGSSIPTTGNLIRLPKAPR